MAAPNGIVFYVAVNGPGVTEIFKMLKPLLLSK